ncbi:SLAM family member 5-like isoform X4 [Hemiscyllium ocellatum]|uniref:SLAM family member 5-like isoform X4 n=1 Tax=Hemiscyllium ocellatum TaxID=170820 RepID=UPI002966AA38|nr:SLAM family member 5-like isoform X4 [Hemiscyllium ocellatum]
MSGNHSVSAFLDEEKDKKWKMKSSTLLNLQNFKLPTEPVSQPLIKIHDNCVNSPNITLSCSVSKGTNVTIYWEKMSLSGVCSKIHAREVLMIDCVSEKEQHEYRCIAENPVSNATSNQVTFDPREEINLKGKRNHFVVLISVVMIVLVSTIVYCWTVFHCKTGSSNRSASDDLM